MIDIKTGDCRDILKTLKDKSIDCVVTSPPYWGLRDYGNSSQMGMEQTPEEYIYNLVQVFGEIRRVLKDKGTVWLNIGDSYYNYRPGKGQALVQQTVSNSRQDLPDKCARRGNKLEGLKEKDLIGIPWMLAFALRADGWYLRQDIIWHKPNPMPESVQDRCTKSHEYIFLFSKYPKYYFNQGSIREEAKYPEPLGANKRSVWTVNTKPYKEAHFAVFPTELIEPCIKAGCAKGGVVLDPFGGSGTTGLVADRLGRNAVIIELNKEYIRLASNRVKDETPLFTDVVTS